MYETTIGINFGRESIICAVLNNKMDFIKFDGKEELKPVIFYKLGKLIIGNQAYENTLGEPENGITLGQVYDNFDYGRWTIEDEEFNSIQVIETILQYIKKIVKEYLCVENPTMVIAVPTIESTNWKQNFILAAQQVGLEQIQFIEDYTALMLVGYKGDMIQELKEDQVTDKTKSKQIAVGAIISTLDDSNLIKEFKNTPSRMLEQNLGVRLSNGKMSVILREDQPYPCQETRVFTTIMDFQRFLRIDIYECPSQYSLDDNTYITSALLKHIEPAQKGVPQIDVTFYVNEDKVLYIKVKDKKNQQVILKSIQLNDNRKNGGKDEE